jgi:hypothetical protein
MINFTLPRLLQGVAHRHGRSLQTPLRIPPTVFLLQRTTLFVPVSGGGRRSRWTKRSKCEIPAHGYHFTGSMLVACQPSRCDT